MLLSKKNNIVFYVLGSLITIGYLSIVYYLTPNVPNWDDYDAVLRFLADYKSSTGVLAKFKLLFSQHNEHRIVLDRVIILGSYAVIGTVHFKWLAVVGNLFLLALLALLWKVYQEFFTPHNWPWWVFLPMALMVLSLQNWQNSFWAMASIQNYGVIFFSFIAFYSLNRNSNQFFIVAIIAAIVAVYTSGSGLLAFILGAAFIWHQSQGFKRLSIWSGIGLLTIASYFYNYHSHSGHPSPLKTIIKQPDLLLPHYFTFLGSTAQPLGLLFTILLGFAVVVFFLWLLQQRYDKHNVLLFTFFVWILLSAALVSVSRAGFGVLQALDSRYYIYGILLLIIVLWIMMSLTKASSKQMLLWGAGVWVLSLGLHLTAFLQSFPALSNTSEQLRYGAACYHEGHRYSSLSYPDQTIAREILRRCDSLGIYRLNHIKYADLASRKSYEFRKYEETNHIKSDFKFEAHPDLLFIDNGWAFEEGMPTENSRVFVVLRNTQTKEQYTYHTIRHYRHDVGAYYQNHHYDWAGFTFILPKSHLPKGRYQVGIMIKHRHGPFKLRARQVLKWMEHDVLQ
jgi:hypothetical protein